MAERLEFKSHGGPINDEPGAFLGPPLQTGFGYSAVPNPNPHTLPPRSKSFWARTVTKLGGYQLLVLVGGNVFLLAGLGTLRYLWPWKSRGESDMNWKNLVLSDSSDSLTEQSWERFIFSGWLLRVITLSSIVIRVSMAAQAAVFCMVMASISLQRSNVVLGDLAAVSIYRFTNSGPYNMIGPLLRTRNDWKSTMAVVATVLLSLTTLASQFTSTILLTDIGTKGLRTSEMYFNVSYGGKANETAEFYVGTTASTWDDRPSTYQVFAEKATANIAIDGPPGEGGLFATGSSFRALLPLEKPERTSLAEYRGPAALIDSRVICVSPSISELSVTEFDAASRVGEDSSSVELRIMGIFTADTFTKNSDELVSRGFFTRNQFSNELGEMQFDCRSPHTVTEVDRAGTEPFPEWKVSMCQLYNVSFTGVAQSESSISSFYDGIMNIGLVVLNMTGYDPSWSALKVNETNIGFGKRVGEWTTISYPSPANDSATSLDLSISVCFTSFSSTNALITARADWNLTEPTLSKNTDAPRYNTTAIRKQLGVFSGGNDDLDYEKRGILKLADVNHTSVDDLIDTQTYIEGSLLDQNLGRFETLGLFQIPTARMCIWCEPDILVHEGFISIFGDTLAATGRPALAVQAFFTARVLQVYGNRSPDFLFTKVAKANFFRLFQVPTLLKGFYIVSAIVAFHFCLMMYITFLFFKVDGQTSLGQAWQTIGQTQSPELQGIMAVSKTSTDKEVKKWLTAKGECNNLIGIRDGTVVQRTSTHGRPEYTPTPEQGYNLEPIQQFGPSPIQQYGPPPTQQYGPPPTQQYGPPPTQPYGSASGNDYISAHR